MATTVKFLLREMANRAYCKPSYKRKEKKQKALVLPKELSIMLSLTTVSSTSKINASIINKFPLQKVSRILAHLYCV